MLGYVRCEVVVVMVMVVVSRDLFPQVPRSSELSKVRYSNRITPLHIVKL